MFGRHFGMGISKVLYLSPSVIKCRTPKFEPSDSKVMVGVTVDGMNFVDYKNSTDNSDIFLQLQARIRLSNVQPRIVMRQSVTMIYLRGKNFVPGMRCLFESSIVSSATLIDSTQATCQYSDTTTKFQVEQAGGTATIQVELLLPSDPSRFAFYAISENLLTISVREPPQYEAITPFFGTTYGGTRVIIRGTNL